MRAERYRCEGSRLENPLDSLLSYLINWKFLKLTIIVPRMITYKLSAFHLEEHSKHLTDCLGHWTTHNWDVVGFSSSVRLTKTSTNLSACWWSFCDVIKSADHFFSLRDRRLWAARPVRSFLAISASEFVEFSNKAKLPAVSLQFCYSLRQNFSIERTPIWEIPVRSRKWVDRKYAGGVHFKPQYKVLLSN